VYAVDVGYGQIAWSLRTNERVKVIERVNARSLTVQLLKDSVESYFQPELAVIDVSFISLSKVLPAIKECLSSSGQIIALVKPQFEAGPENVGKNGVVKSPEIHALVLERIVAAAETLGIYSENLTFSPLKGPQGNIEFLLLLKLSGSSLIDQTRIAEIVAEANTTLKRKSEIEAEES
jgi:23S rRNA (cytidine1920-2'-O)/16S rRNA (cytidine1409-2'-O)-methyltransferase